ncbi:MAG: phosphate uptake regulator PhoU [bacterium]
MELRKIQVTGGSTHVVSLPKKWIDRNRLGRSDPIAIHEEPDGSLLLIPHGEAKAAGRSIAVDLAPGGPPEDVVRRLVGAYLAGAQEIVVKTGPKMDAKTKTQVRNVTRALIGMEILEESAGSLTLHDLVGVSDMDLRKTLTRMHRIARLMYDDAVGALKAGDAATARSVVERDDELDRLLWMVSKQMHALLEQPRLAANLNVRPAEALNLFLAARSVERMGDHATKIANNLLAMGKGAAPKPVLEALVAQADVVRGIWEDAFASLKKPDFDQASRAADAGEAAAAWRAKFPSLLGQMHPDLVGSLTLIADSIDRTRGYAVDIAETAMNQTFQRQP